jgi:exopolysaccharide biosynthesis polyprenyl glycosylphosphotransferase
LATPGTKLYPETAAPTPANTASDPRRSPRTSIFHVRRSLFVITDFLGIWGGALLALALRMQTLIPTPLHRSVDLPDGLALVALYSALMVLFCHTQRLYSAYQAASGRKEMQAILKGIVMATLLLSGFLFASGIKTTSRYTVAATAISALAWMTTWRYLRRRTLRKAVADGLTCYNVLIVGTDALARAVQEHLTRQRQLGFVVLGLLSSDPEPTSELQQADVLGRIADLPHLCRRHFIDEIIICGQDREAVKRVIVEAQISGVGVRVVPDLYDGMAWGAQLDYLGDFPSLTVVHRHIPAIELKLKRALDIVVSATALAVLAPVLILLAIAIKFDSRGPIFYVSQRVGRKGRIFSCFKFRTMVADAEKLKSELTHLNERDGVLFKIKDDPRITRMGRVMRKYSLDEIVQLWNVIKGDMSLVGPRPPLAAEVQQYELEYLRRLEVAPGITGLWQVEAREHPSFDRYIALDLRYVENWSLALDVKILLRTIAVVFAGTGS